MFVYDDNALTKDDLTKLLKLISKDKLKFAFSAHAVKVGDKGYHFVNEPLDRKGKRNKHYAFFKSILVSIVKKHNLKLKKIICLFSFIVAVYIVYKMKSTIFIFCGPSRKGIV